jgi:hypothetical protein
MQHRLFAAPFAGLFGVSVVLPLLTACGPEEKEEKKYTIADAPLSGKINGEDFNFTFGLTTPFLSDDEGLFSELHGIAVPDEPVCEASITEPESYILVTLPREQGEHEMSLRQNGTFTFGDAENYIVTDGLIRIDEVTETEVTGGLYMIYEGDADFEVSGEFSATICPDV